MNVAIIIVNYNCQDLICKCISSLKHHLKTCHSIIVVDNSEKADTERIKAQFQDVIIKKTEKNLGFAGGVNVGIKHALSLNSDYILILNPDTITEHDFLSPLLFVMETNSSIAVSGPKILVDNEQKSIWAAGGRLNWWIGKPGHILKEDPNLYEVPFLSGCALLIRTSAIMEIGLMPEFYFLYFEDADYLQQFIKQGKKIIYVSSSEILHTPSSTTGYQSERYVYYFARNRIWFMRRWATWYHFLIFVLFTLVIKAPGAVVVFGLVRRQAYLANAFFKGLYDGFFNYDGN